jgi:hypothetical protein
MTPLPDRVVIAGLLMTIALCFALAFWTVRQGPAHHPLQWREAPQSRPGSSLI